MRIGVTYSSATDFSSIIDDVVAFENAGIDAVWLGESYGYDAITALGALAQATSRIQVGSGIIPIYSRTPALIAQTAAGLDAISGGRAALGLGASGPAVIEGWHGVPYDAPVGRTREIVNICRSVWKRERLEHHGRYEIPLANKVSPRRPLKLIAKPPREQIPIYIAALGKRNVELTAEVANGWIPAFFWPDKCAQVWGSALAKGKSKRSEELGPLEIVTAAHLAIGDDVAPYVEHQRPFVAHYIGGMGPRSHNFYNDIAVAYGFPDAAAKIQDLYLDGKKSDAEAAVPSALLNGISLVGPEALVRERLKIYADVGVSMINVTPAGTSIEEKCFHINSLRRLIDSL
ncbi:MAG: LLM class F420-dependent oxidoreductase [Antricoccus sp.]